MITLYKTIDGKMFDNEQKASEHEETILNARYKYIESNFSIETPLAHVLVRDLLLIEEIQKIDVQELQAQGL